MASNRTVARDISSIYIQSFRRKNIMRIENESKRHWYHRNLRIVRKGLMPDSLSVLSWIDHGLPVHVLKRLALTGMLHLNLQMQSIHCEKSETTGFTLGILYLNFFSNSKKNTTLINSDELLGLVEIEGHNTSSNISNSNEGPKLNTGG
jgi:hypothetical protein